MRSNRTKHKYNQRTNKLTLANSFKRSVGTERKTEQIIFILDYC